MQKQKRILKKLYDVKPVKTDGSLDMEKIGGFDRIVRVEKKYLPKKNVSFQKMGDIRKPASPWHAVRPSSKIGPDKKRPLEKPETRRANIIHLGKRVPNEILSVSKIYTATVLFDKKAERREISDECVERDPGGFFENEIQEKKAEFEKCVIFSDSDISKSTEKILVSLESGQNKKKKKRRNRNSKSRLADFFPKYDSLQIRFSSSFSFIAAIFLFSLILPAFAFIQRGIEVKKLLSGSGDNVMGVIAEAQSNLSSGQFEKASSNFEQSYEILKSANDEVSKIGGDFSEILRFIPGVSKIATANYLLSAGENISLAGKIMVNSMKPLAKIENPLEAEMNFSLAELFLNLREGVRDTAEKLKAANEDIQKTNFEDLPPEIQPQFSSLKKKLPLVVSSLDSFSDNSNIILDVLGYNGPRKFLFLFQNNQEMRATGGFIGSYGILDMSDGRIKKLFVDDIYNPDGQLTAKIIPPEPIQKMSAVWTMHDANWFPNFPTSAEKVAWFYEKTGGPTVDGVIAMSPNVIEKMLSITGPIDMPEYGATVDKDNFREIAQYEVEVDYDKEQNQPKKFIADLTPKILNELLSTKNPKMMLMALDIVGYALKEKHILVYSKNYNIQKMISGQGWSGEMLSASKDYLSVINSNINGYKTDGVIDETIEHNAQIGADGNIVDEVTVTRKHNGGNEKYDWWNRVNGNYVRVYVPKGSKLLEASGQTREFVSPPLDYQSLQFKKDPQVSQIEEATTIDEASGTRIYTEDGKTVFANWVYVSPGETVTLKYKYQLPFKLFFDDLHHPAESFSILYQKQSGSVGSSLFSSVRFPSSYKVIWKYPDLSEVGGNEVTLKTKLETDKFIGFAAEKGQ
ncbi:MAG: hypothetical protein A2407_04055 [Candidatus Moranbacteria bacterium RIFOXYC1_FULL_44_8]|nr:MAG: hypothetical protein A2407_04055 [Candidatus Moranbacteria bacterium RIFOXYC1_FULL_44_8]